MRSKNIVNLNYKNYDNFINNGFSFLRASIYRKVPPLGLSCLSPLALYL